MAPITNSSLKPSLKHVLNIWIKKKSIKKCWCEELLFRRLKTFGLTLFFGIFRFLRNLIILLRIPFMWWASLSLLSRFFISGFWAFDYNVYLCGFLSEFCLLGVPLAFWIYIIISFLKFGTFSSITFSNILSKYFSFLFWDLHSVYIGLTNDVPQIP